MIMNEDKQVAFCRATSSLSTLIGSLTSYISNFYKSNFPKNFIRKMYISDSMNALNLRDGVFQDQNKPYLVITPRFELGNTFLENPPIWHTTSLYLFRNKARYYRKIFDDKENGIRIYVIPNRIKINYETIIKVQMQMAAWDLLSYINQHFEANGFRYANRVPLQAEIPKNFVVNISKILGLDYNDKDDRLKLRDYFKQHSLNSITEIINLSTGNPSWMFNYFNNVLLNFPDMPTSERTTTNLAHRSATVNFNFTAEVWMPCSFVMEVDKSKIKEDFNMEESMEAIDDRRFQFNLAFEKPLIPEKIEDKQIIFKESFLPDVNVEVDELPFDSILSKEMIRVIDTLVKYKIPLEKVIDIKLFSNGYPISKERYEVDYENYILKTKEPNSNITYTLILYGNLKILNEVNNLVLTDNTNKIKDLFK